MGERTRRWGIAIAMAALAGLGAGCSGSPNAPIASATPSPPSTLGMPYVFGPCEQVVVYPEPGQGGYVQAYNWDDDVHAYGETVSITACLATAFMAVPEGPAGVSFDPAQQLAPKTEFHVITYTVTVSEGATGPTFVRLDDPEGGGSFATAPGPVITPSGDGWRFMFPTDP